MTDLIIINGEILTMAPGATATAVAVEDGLISAVGDGNSIMARKKTHTRVLDLNGKILCPGFIDPHLHFRALAESVVDIDLSPQANIASIDHILDRLHEASLTVDHGKWIRGAGYNEVYLEEMRHPDRWEIDRACPNHPVKLTHRSTYAHVLNSPAMKEIGIDRYTADPDGGIMERDLKTGEPTGLFFGMGAYLSERIPELADKDLFYGAKSANEQLLSQGITSFQDASARNDERRFQWLSALKKDGTVRPRAGMIMGLEWFKRVCEDGGLLHISQEEVALGGVKVIIDETTGKLNPGREELNDIILSIHISGQQAVVHAIEDTAIEAALGAFEKALSLYPKNDHRHRIEHCSVCPPSLIKKISALGLTVVTHPAFVFYNGDRYLKTVSSHQMANLYPLSKLITAGIDVAAASDGPIVNTDPMSGIFGAVNRLSQTGQAVPGSEGISPLEAIGLYTSMAAKAGFGENIKGTISEGKVADLIVLSASPLTAKPHEIRDIEVLTTLINGKTVWQK